MYGEVRRLRLVALVRTLSTTTMTLLGNILRVCSVLTETEKKRDYNRFLGLFQRRFVQPATWSTFYPNYKTTLLQELTLFNSGKDWSRGKNIRDAQTEDWGPFWDVVMIIPFSFFLSQGLRNFKCQGKGKGPNGDWRVRNRAICAGVSSERSDRFATRRLVGWYLWLPLGRSSFHVSLPLSLFFPLSLSRPFFSFSLSLLLGLLSFFFFPLPSTMAIAHG